MSSNALTTGFKMFRSNSQSAIEIVVLQAIDAIEALGGDVYPPRYNVRGGADCVEFTYMIAREKRDDARAALQQCEAEFTARKVPVGKRDVERPSDAPPTVIQNRPAAEASGPEVPAELRGTGASADKA